MITLRTWAGRRVQMMTVHRYGSASLAEASSWRGWYHTDLQPAVRHRTTL